MSTHTTPQQAADKVKEAANAVADSARNEARDAADQAGTALGRVSEKIRDVTSTASEKLHDGAAVARERLHDGALAARDKGEEIYVSVKDLIREKPIPAVIGFAALGFALAYAFFPRRERSASVADRLANALSPWGERLHDRYDSLRSRGGDLLEEVDSHIPRHPIDSVLGQVRGFGKNLKFW